MKNIIVITICCIALCFAFSSVASAKGNPHDPGSSLSANAYVKCHSDDPDHVWIALDDLEIYGQELIGIYGNGTCTYSYNFHKNSCKISCKAMGAAVNCSHSSTILPSGVSVDLANCTIKRCDPTHTVCYESNGTGQATLSNNYDDDGHANVNLTCSFSDCVELD